MSLKGPKRKRERELDKRARSDTLHLRQGALFADAGEAEVAFKKKLKTENKVLELDSQGTEGENELDQNESNQNEHKLELSNSRNGHSTSSMDEQRRNSECRENAHTKSSKKVQALKPESTNTAQQFNSKRCEKEQKEKSERSDKGRQPNFKSGGKKHIVKSEGSIEGQELPGAKDNNNETVKVLVDVKRKKKKKTKKKRDRWGQVLNDAGNTQDTSNDDVSARLCDSDKLDNAAYNNGNLVLTGNDMHKGEHDCKTVCAGGMPYDTSEEDIRSFFKECGTVACVVCMKFADTQRFKGLAFITFEMEAAALKALSLDGANMGGRVIKVEKMRTGGKVLQAPPKREAGSLSVYVGNLDWGVQKIDIKRFFKGCDIDNVRLAVDRNTGDFRGYGHVDFSDEKSLEKAMKMNQKQLLGRSVKVSYAVHKGFKAKSIQMQ